MVGSLRRGETEFILYYFHNVWNANLNIIYRGSMTSYLEVANSLLDSAPA